MIYQIPKEHFFRIHHIRPRFKNDVENVLLHIANSIENIGKKSTKEFSKELLKAIYLYPGNLQRKEKTMQNWRTEISSLFGLIEYDKDKCFPSNLTKELNTTGDLIQFFRHFLFTFQYPGGHLKPQEVKKLIENNIKFHPAKYILELLVIGTENNDGKRYGISKAEATHHIFNDLRVTREGLEPLKIYQNIELARKKKYEYDTGGDIVRYAGDILDYLVLADLLDHKLDGKYYPRMQNLEVIASFLNKTAFFEGYDNYYNQEVIQISDIRDLEQSWFSFANQSIEKRDFATNIEAIFDFERLDEKPELSQVRDYIKQIATKELSTLEIGNLGESITIEHERKRIKSAGRENLIHNIKKIPNQLAVGYDIKSFLGLGDDFRHIQIEVKSTISKNPLQVKSFSMTGNEWDAATSYEELYFIYRLLISSSDIELFVIRNPVGQYKKDKIKISFSQGVIITYSEDAGDWQRILA